MRNKKTHRPPTHIYSKSGSLKMLLKSKKLILLILFPLSLASSSFLLIHYLVFQQNESVFANLGTGFIASIITIFYIDLILRKSEEDKLKPINSFVSYKLLLLKHRLILVFLEFSIATLPTEQVRLISHTLQTLIFKQSKNKSSNFNEIMKIRKMLGKRSKYCIDNKNQIREAVASLDTIQYIESDLNKLLDNYGSHISIDAFNFILEIIQWLEWMGIKIIQTRNYPETFYNADTIYNFFIEIFKSFSSYAEKTNIFKNYQYWSR